MPQAQHALHNRPSPCPRKREALPLFERSRLAKRPYCTDDLESGLRVRGVETALQRRYLQANHPSFLFRIVLDIDHPIHITAHTTGWEGDFGVPEPSWTALSPESGRGHVGYELAAPVARHANARSAPIKWAAAIEDGLARKLGADAGYSGLVCKNPVHPDWTTVQGRSTPYDLAELAEWVDTSNSKRRKPKQETAFSLGRNCLLFELLRSWAYGQVHAFRERSFDDWKAAVERQACEFNNFHGTSLRRTDPLEWGELRRVARSIAGWTWKSFGQGSAHADFLKRQTERALRGAASKRAKTEEEIRRAQATLVSEGQQPTMRAVTTSSPCAVLSNARSARTQLTIPPQG